MKTYLLHKNSIKTLVLSFLIATSVLMFLGVLPAPGDGQRDLVLRSFSPQGLVPGTTEIKLVFSKPVVHEKETGVFLSEDVLPIQITPHLKGRGKWLDTSTFLYTPIGGIIAPATLYRVSVKGVRDINGKALSGKPSFEFYSPRLEFKAIRQVDFNLSQQRVEYELEFSLPVSPFRLKGFLEFRNSKQESLAYTPSNGPPSNKVRVSLSATNNETLAMSIAEGLTSESGPLGLEKKVQASLKTSLKMIIQEVFPFVDLDSGQVLIRTSAPVDIKTASSFIELRPSLPFTLEPTEEGVLIQGDFNPRDRLTIKILKGFPSLGGGTLQEDWEQAFIFPDRSTSVRFAGKGRILSPLGNLMIPIEVVNSESLSVNVWRLFENNIPLAMHNRWASFPSDLAELIATKSYRVQGRPNEVTRRSLNLKSIIGDKKGVFLVTAGTDTSNYRQYDFANKTLNITDLGVTAKIAPTGALFWVNSVSTGKPIPEAKISLWSSSNQLLGEGYTNAKGICHITRENPWDQKSPPAIATVSVKDDISFIRFDENLWTYSNFDINGRPYTRQTYEAFCYIPRNIYRPGEKVSINTLVRDGKLNPPKPFPITLRIFSPIGKEWSKKSLLLSEEGRATHLLTLPHSAPTGSWTAEVLLPGNNVPIGNVHFYVEDFAPPRIAITTSSPQQRLTAGEKGKLNFNARYLFDAPAANLPYEVMLSLLPRDYTHPKWEAFVFGDPQLKIENESTLIASGALSDQGKGETDIKTKNWRPPSMLDLQLRIGVMEDGGRWVYKTHVIPYYPTATMVGIESPSRTPSIGQKTPFRVVSVHPDGSPSKGTKLHAVLSKTIYRTLLSEKEDGVQSRVQSEFIEVERRDVSLKQGLGNVDFTIQRGGQYILHISDPLGGGTASTQFYVYDPNWVSDSEEGDMLPNRLDIILDHSTYKLGDTVTAKITPPYEGTMLFTVETDKIVHQEIRQVKNSTSMNFSFKVNEDMRPNAWVSATLIRPVTPEALWSSHRAFGVVALAIDNTPNRLDVVVESASKLTPSAKNNFSITLKDARGRLSGGEVTLMLVDEGIHSLTNYQSPNPWEYFTARRALGVGFYDIYDALLPIESLKTPRLHPGGDAPAQPLMDAKMLSPIHANRFKNLTLLKTVSVGGNGKADFSFVLPEFSGTARLVAVASAKNLFGMADKRIPIGRDVTLEPSLPRAVAPLDLINAPFQLFSTTDKTIPAKVSVTAEGPISIDGSSQHEVTLSPKQNRMRLPLILRAKNSSGIAKLTYTLKIGEKEYRQVLELAVRPPYPRISKTGATLLKTGEKSTLKIPLGWFPGSQQGILLLSGFPQVQLADIAQFLIGYPYGCLEQTVSASWPLLMEGDILREINPAFSNSYNRQTALAGKISRIQSLQNYDGGFANWGGTFETSAWNSVYATHFLVAANKKGVRLPSNLLDSSLSYVRQLIALAPEAGKNETDYAEALTLRAYASYVLALKGEPHLGWMEYLKDREGELNSAGKNLLAAAYATAGQKDTALKILAGKSIAITTRGENKNLDSPLRDQATALLAWVQLSPRDSRTALYASELLGTIRKLGLLSTQESGFSFIALSQYFALNPAEKKPRGSIHAKGKKFASLDDTIQSANVDLRTIHSPISVTNEGESRLFAAWTVSGIPSTAPKNEDKGLKVRIALKNSNGEDILKKASISRGERIIGTLTLQPKSGNIRHVVVNVILPGGLEIENPRLITDKGAGENLQGMRTELRDDRLILFVDSLEKTITWDFTLRAVTAGEFQIPPIAAEAMYNPSIQSLFGGGRLRIK